MNPTVRRALVSSILALAATSAGAAAVALPASATPPSNGCPAGFQLLSVADLGAQGYQVPAKLDDPSTGLRSFGRPGNGDGYVCGVPLGNQTTPWGSPIYTFLNDTLRA